MRSTFRPDLSQRGFQSLMVAILVLLVLGADPHVGLSHLPQARAFVVDILRGARLWLVCLAVCFTVNRMIEMVLQRRVRRAWVYILLWSAIIPAAYEYFVRQLELRWPGRGENNILLLTTTVIVTAFAGAVLKRMADSVTRTAHFDPLTTLPNRAMLRDVLERSIADASKNKTKMAVCMLNIDCFKRINVSLGHGGGDALLLRVAKQLQASVRAGDLVARIGGDEFVVVMPDVENMAEAEELAQQMLDAISAPVMVSGREVCITATHGLCVYPDGAADAAAALHAADSAMHDAKAMGRVTVQTGVPAFPRSDRLELEEDFRHALENDELTLHYQPQVQLSTHTVTGLEALLRWDSPKRGSVPPAEFIPIVEEVGLMVPVGEWALRRACVDCKELQRATGLPLTMALNLSARQFGRRNLARLVGDTLTETGLAPHHLELEITEQMLMVNSPQMVATLQAIRDLGVGIAIDDFGTGFSSFAYIMQYHVDRIKIDQSFIARSIQDPHATAVVRTIIAMAHGLDMRVVAEGVETLEQSDFLQRRRCDDAQGFLFARAMPKSDVAAAVLRIGAALRQGGLHKGLKLPLGELHPPLPGHKLPN